MKKPETDEQMMIDLATQAKDLPGNVENTIYRMKSAQNFQAKVKSLGGVLKADLISTYAFLLNTTLEDPMIARLTQPGLQKMIVLKQQRKLSLR